MTPPTTEFIPRIDLEMPGKCVSHARTDCSARDVNISVDEPVARGGTNTGLTPTETLWAALLGCTNVIGQRCAKKHGMKIMDIDLQLNYTFDRRGGAMREEVEVPFPKATLNINVTSDADEETVEKVKADLARFCPVSKVIINSGCDLVTVWNVSQP